MAYQKSTWANTSAGNTPLNAARMNHLETQYDEALAAVAAAGYVTPDAYTILNNSYVWSYANNAAGPGPGGIIIDSTAAPNVARNTSAKASEGYIAMGREALGAATRARACIAIGSLALGLGNPGFGNLAIGAFSLSNVQGISEYAADMPGSRNIGIGTLAGYFVSSGYYNTFVGRDSGQTATTGIRNTGLGYGAFARGIAPVGIDGKITNYYPSAGSDNTALGTQAGQMSVGSNNTFAGSQAGAQLRASSSNVIVGAGAALVMGAGISENSKALTTANIMGAYSQSGTTITITATAHGAVAGNQIGLTFTSGPINAATGEMQWMTVVTVINADAFTVKSPVSQAATGNVTVGTVETATTAVAGGAMTVIGFQALADATNNDGNTTVVGEQAARSSSGARNSLLGSRAGFNLTTGTDNTLIGYNAGRALTTGGGMTAESNSTAIGSGSSVSGSNQVQLGNPTTTTYVYGTVQNRSDERDKADIQNTALGLDWVVKHPRPKDYRWDMREDYVEYDDEGAIVEVRERDGSKKRERLHHGVIAQEVEAYIEETGVDFGGYQDHARAGGSDVKSIGYDEYIAPLLAAIQDLHAIVVKQGQEIAKLKS